MNQSAPLSSVFASARNVGMRVEFIMVVIDRIGVMRLQPGIGDILVLHTEPDVTGFDVRVVTIIPWSAEEIPEYYLPKSFPHGDGAGSNGGNGSNGVNGGNGGTFGASKTFEARNILYIPARHVIRNILDETRAHLMPMVLSRFFRRAPYGWKVLYNEPRQMTQHQVPEGQAPQDQGPQVAAGVTRRISGEVVDFGIDVDGELKLIISCLETSSASLSLPCSLDNSFVDGAFFETKQLNFANPHLYKLPYELIHDAYDQADLGEQTYQSMLKHILCDTLFRYRIKTVKYQEQEVENQGKKKGVKKSFYYGFTEDGFHFSQNGRQVLNTEITESMFSDPHTNEEGSLTGYETRSPVYIHNWLNLRPPQKKEIIHTPIKRGYIIYGRLVQKAETGQTTLEWCTPTPGLDLLRVYLVTDGQSPIFRTLNREELLVKLKDKDGNETLASQLFLGLIDPNARNLAIDYVKKEFMWP